MTVDLDGSGRIDGSLSIAQFNDEFGEMLNEGEFETIGGLILHQLGELPEEGVVIALGKYSFAVEEVEANRIKTLGVRKIEGDDRESPEEPEESQGVAFEEVK